MCPEAEASPRSKKADKAMYRRNIRRDFCHEEQFNVEDGHLTLNIHFCAAAQPAIWKKLRLFVVNTQQDNKILTSKIHHFL
jgi:hypothetical protein